MARYCSAHSKVLVVYIICCLLALLQTPAYCRKGGSGYDSAVERVEELATATAQTKAEIRSAMNEAKVIEEGIKVAKKRGILRTVQSALLGLR